MSQIEIPGSSGYALMSDRSLDFYKDPMHFCNSRIQSNGSRIFQARLLNKPTIFVCSVKGMNELLCEKVNVFDTSYTTSMCKLFGDNVCFANGEEAQLLRISLMQLFRGKMLDTYADYINRVCTRNLKDLSMSEPIAVYTLFKRLATELVLGIFLNVDAEKSAELSKQITQLSTQHWHGLISAPVNLKVSVWSSGFSQALEAKEKLLHIINERLKSEEDGNAGQEKLLCCFGNGSRNCIGVELNDLILKTAVGYLLNHYCWDLDPPNQSLEYKWLPVSRPAEDPKIKFTSCSYKT
uniref:uncharacterized protein isoform X1 n=1 Tax=Pristiophorus japonicus TaxID=55135 RepID=UPI00398EDD5A